MDTAGIEMFECTYRQIGAGDHWWASDLRRLGERPANAPWDRPDVQREMNDEGRQIRITVVVEAGADALHKAGERADKEFQKLHPEGALDEEWRAARAAGSPAPPSRAAQ
jgi:hypothetical protein